ncbi:MAG: triose-phosphate isomerase [Rhizobiales bacterium]|nr:triose-phosphate isomerase [Hyphomicrobiales bacterium]
MAPPRTLIAGNWKMNGLRAALGELAAMAQGLEALSAADRLDVLVCPPATLIAEAAGAMADRGIAIGAQDCHPADAGAHTGDLSAVMLADAGATAIILGHSERRGDHGETDGLVACKAASVGAAGLTAIVCIGETLGQRRYGLTLDVLERQLAASIPASLASEQLVVAYEPVWAIGTGLTPSLDDVASAHGFLRDKLVARYGSEAGNGVRLLYGGSVKAGNAAELLSITNVNGALVGGASLKASDFLGIVSAACAG